MRLQNGSQADEDGGAVAMLDGPNSGRLPAARTAVVRQAIAPTTNAHPDRIGPLTSADFMPAVWDCLVSAATVAAQWQDATITSTELFIGMLTNPDGAAAHAIGRFGIDPVALRTALMAEAAERNVGAIPLETSLSASVGSIMLLARSEAAGSGREKVNEADLLSAFAIQGGGEMGQWLRKRGFSTVWLATGVFDTEGNLERGRFLAEALDIIDHAVRYARNKGYAKIGRRHLLYAMLDRPQGIMAARLTAQRRTAGVLADLLDQQVPPQPGPAIETARARAMSGGLISALSAAELYARDRSEDRVGEFALLRGLLQDGGGEITTFLKQQGVRWGELLR